MAQFLLNLPEELLKEVDKMAERFYLSRTAYVITTLRIAIQEFAEKEKKHGNRK